MSTPTPSGGATEHAPNNLASSSSGDSHPAGNNPLTLTPRSRAGGATQHAFRDLAMSLGDTVPGRNSVDLIRTGRRRMKFPSSDEQLALEARNAHLNAQLAVTVAAQMAEHPPLPFPSLPVPHIEQAYRISQVPPPAGGASEHRARMELTTLDMGTLDIITRFCATSPDAQHNGIAVTNRYFNIAWRRMHRNVARHMMRQLLSVVHDNSHHILFRSAPACFNGICIRGYERQQILEFACEDLSDIWF